MAQNVNVQEILQRLSALESRPLVENRIQNLENNINQVITNRLNALERNNEIPITEDLSDPPLYLTNLNGQPASIETIEKIPDYVKDLPIFTGNPNEVSSWISDVESIINYYKPNETSTVDQKNKYHIICKTIRRKIRGEANDALVSSNVNINWTAIKKTLLTYYGEKRDIASLDYQMLTIQQKGKTLEEYFDEINNLLSLIANQIKTSNRFTHPEAVKALIETYNEKALDAFMRGLDGELLGQFLKNYRPESLAQAYAYCISFQNIEFRKKMTRGSIPEKHNGPKNFIPNNSNNPKIPPKLPPKPQMQNKPNYPQPPKFFRPVYYPQQPVVFRQQQQPVISQQQRQPPPVPSRQPPNNPFRQPAGPSQPTNQQRNQPEPMEVDPSIRTRQVNYSNRPDSNTQQQKRPRMFFVSNADGSIPVEYMEPIYEYDDSNNGNNNNDEIESFDRYLVAYEHQEGDGNASQETTDNAEFNFLE